MLDLSLIIVNYKTPGLIGGYYDGTTTTGSNVASAGAFSMSKTGTGQYQLTVPGQSPSTGMLLLSVTVGVEGRSLMTKIKRGQWKGQTRLYLWTIGNLPVGFTGECEYCAVDGRGHGTSGSKGYVPPCTAYGCVL